MIAVIQYKVIQVERISAGGAGVLVCSLPLMAALVDVLALRLVAPRSGFLQRLRSPRVRTARYSPDGSHAASVSSDTACRDSRSVAYLAQRSHRPYLLLIRAISEAFA